MSTFVSWTRVLRAVSQTIKWLDSYTHSDEEAELTLRILKVSEECGEAAGAWIGVLGQNPRKGVTHTRIEVAEELADVVITALVAIASLGLDPSAVMLDKANYVLARMEADKDRDEA